MIEPIPFVGWVEIEKSMEEEFNQWAMENVEPWPHPQKILQNYWIVWQAAWNRASTDDHLPQ
tara:strand:- start:7146 stop:7331 length:186 start_codon:yes stop_codon:yes gene_type:complete